MVARLPIAPGGRLLDFRRRNTPPRRRRRSPLARLVRPLLLALSAVALPVGLSAWVLGSQRFALRDLVVTSGPRVAPETARAALAPLRGENLLLLSLPLAADRLRRLPWIASAEMRKELPNRLRVAVIERQPVVLLAGGGALAFADAEGRAIAPLTAPAEIAAARRQGLLEVSLSPAAGEPAAAIAGALAVASELRRVHPDWAMQLTSVDVLGEEDYRLHSQALPCPVLVNRGRLAAHLRRLEEVLPLLEHHYTELAAIDLRFTRRIVIQPSLAAAQRDAGVS